jgi:iron-sulfur cluster assembly protein
MIHLSKSAASEIQRLQSKRQNMGTKLRLGVQTGGCADFFYTLDFDTTVKPEDQIYDQNGIQVVVDPQSLSYISDLTLDYSEDLMGGGFRFHNPQASASCSCGNSFSMAQ